MEFLLHGSVPKSGMHAEAASPSDPICRLLIAGKNLFLASTYDIKTTHGAQKLQQSNAITGQDDYRRNLCPRILALKPIRQASTLATDLLRSMHPLLQLFEYWPRNCYIINCFAGSDECCACTGCSH